MPSVDSRSGSVGEVSLENRSQASSLSCAKMPPCIFRGRLGATSKRRSTSRHAACGRPVAARASARARCASSGPCPRTSRRDAPSTSSRNRSMAGYGSDIAHFPSNEVTSQYTLLKIETKSGNKRKTLWNSPAAGHNITRATGAKSLGGRAPGIYHYESAAHRVRLVSGVEAAAGEMALGSRSGPRVWTNDRRPCYRNEGGIVTGTGPDSSGNWSIGSNFARPQIRGREQIGMPHF